MLFRTWNTTLTPQQRKTLQIRVNKSKKCAKHVACKDKIKVGVAWERHVLEAKFKETLLLLILQVAQGFLQRAVSYLNNEKSKFCKPPLMAVHGIYERLTVFQIYLHACLLSFLQQPGEEDITTDILI